ncbi:MAG: type II toxin-antitoxin system mRNA interferase toxin, RelE/StbE family [Thermodesulfobacteriota bacterium]|nr:type II toxin-antitoxin system mRNA interferase toxin, RelE/StbE family [Thermodesulfobacteriota bacterium]
MALYEIRFTKEAVKDVEKLSPRLKKKLKEIAVNLISVEPYAGKKLVGDLKGFYSIRLTYRDRIVYSVDEANKTVYVHRARTHYGE